MFRPFAICLNVFCNIIAKFVFERKMFLQTFYVLHVDSLIPNIDIERTCRLCSGLTEYLFV